MCKPHILQDDQKCLHLAVLPLNGTLFNIVLAFNEKTVLGLIINWVVLKDSMQDLWPVNLVKAEKSTKLHINIQPWKPKDHINNIYKLSNQIFSNCSVIEYD